MVMQGNKRGSEQGMVSILVTLIMMIVISLIVIAISQATRNSQRQQLDQQLSAQAYYAAESGLNQAVDFFASHATAQLNTNGSCTDFITGTGSNGLGGTVGVSNVLDSASKVSYTCLMVNSTPTSLRKAPLSQDSNAVWRLRDANGGAFTQLRFKWQSNGDYTGTNSCTTPVGTNPQYGSWNCSFGILRVDLVDTHGTVPNTTLQQPAKTLYLVPTYTNSGTSSATIVSSATQVGQVVYVTCVSTLCDIALTPAGSSNEYYARLTMIYQDADSVQVSGTDASGTAQFSGGQAVIDVTGKAQDQLRRVQARIPLTSSTLPIPSFALQSTTTLCKQLGVANGVTSTDGCL